MADATILAGERYEVQGHLGSGGMGAVYLVKDQVRGETLALKLLAEAGGLDEASFLRFKQEFRMMAGLSHPGLCAVYDFGRLPDATPYFTMEHVPGEELGARDPEALLPLIGQLCAALGHVHQQGYVHLDLKPENIRVKPDGTLKLMDFGLMAVAGQALDAVRGTLAYVSPEVAKRDRIDQRSDLYSLGVVLYELLTGAPPFKHTSALAQLRAHLTEAPAPIQEIRPDVPEDLARVVMKLLAKEPSARFASVGAVLAALGLAADETGQQGLLASPFVGRAAERERLAAALKARQGKLIKLVGPAGIGKSRLLGEFRFQVQLEELPYLEGACPAEALPYGPWIPVLRALLPLAREACPQTLAEEGPFLGKLLPELAVAEPPALEPEQEKRQIQSAIARLLLGVGARGAVLALESWERVDALAAETLGTVLRMAGQQGTPLLVVVAGQAVAEATGEELALAGLARDEVRALAEGMLGQGGLPERVAEQLHRAAEGNPRLVAGGLEHAVALGAIARAGNGWSVPAELPSEALATDVRRILDDRLAHLGTDVRQAARALAVLGVSFELTLAVGVLGLADEALFDALDALLHAGVLEAAGGAYRFAFPELAATLAAELGDAERLRLHELAAAHLEAGFPADAEPPLADLGRVARHYLAAGDAPRGLPRVVETARRLTALNDFRAGDALVLEADALFAQLPAEPAWAALRCDYMLERCATERHRDQLAFAEAAGMAAVELAAGLGDRERRLRALSDLVHVEGLRGSLEAAHKAIALAKEALPLAEELGAWAIASRIALSRCRPYMVLGETALAMESAKTAGSAATKAGNQGALARALSRLGHMQSGEARTRDEGLANLAAAEEIQGRIGDQYGRAFTQGLMGDIQLESGRYAQAMETFAQHLPIVRELAMVEDLRVALVNVACVCCEMGALERATEALAEVGQDTHAGDPVGQVARAAWCQLTATQGRYDEAVRLLTAVEGEIAGLGPYVLACVLPYLFEAWSIMDRPERAIALAQEATFVLRGANDPRSNTLIALFRADAYAQLGRWDQAEQELELALVGIAAADARGLQVKALRVQAMIVLGRGKPASALGLIEEGQALAVQAGMLPQQALLAGLAGEVAIAEGRHDGQASFQTMQALADQMGAPLLRARALFGQARANPQGERAAGLLAEAQQVVRDLAGAMAEDGRAEFLAGPVVKAIMAVDPAIRPAPTSALEGSRQIGERFGRMTADLQSLASQYDMLFDDWQASNDQLRQLNELATRMNESLHLEEVLKQVVMLTLQITHAERGFVVLKGPHDSLVCRAAFDRDGVALGTATFSLSICHKVMAADKAIAVLDASADADFASAKSVVALDIKTVMGAPLITKGKHLGVLFVDSQAVVATFTEKDLELLRAIASHASVAIENATLYEALDTRARELEEALALYRKAEKDASTDLLTGLANRRAFHETAAKELSSAKRHGVPLSVIMLDVDHFKQFNDTYGHAVGDDVLKAMGRVLPENVRISDLAARLGGEEFVVLCPDTPPEDALALAERIREAILAVKLTDQEGKPVRQLTASLGIAQVQAADGHIDAALERADIALYACKRGGRNQAQVWSAAMPQTNH